MDDENIIEGAREYSLSKRILEEQVDVLFKYTRSYVYYKVIKAHLHSLNGFDFWTHTLNTHLLNSIIEWCKVFGIDSNESHWKKICLNNKQTFEDSIRQRILMQTGFTPKEWFDYWESFCEFRNEYCAHRNPDRTLPVPIMEKSFNAASAYFDFIIDLIPWDRHQDNLKELSNLFESEVNSVVEKNIKA
jgi:hypothetical protein